MSSSVGGKQIVISIRRHTQFCLKREVWSLLTFVYSAHFSKRGANTMKSQLWNQVTQGLALLKLFGLLNQSWRCVGQLTGLNAAMWLIRLRPPELPLLPVTTHRFISSSNKDLKFAYKKLELSNVLHFPLARLSIETDRLSRLVEGISPAQAVLLGSFLACHQRASVWSTISRMSPFRKLIPASAQGMVGSCWGL